MKIFQEDELRSVLEKLISEEIYGISIEDTPISVGQIKEPVLRKEVMFGDGSLLKIAISGEPAYLAERSEFIFCLLIYLGNAMYERKRLLSDSLERYRELAIISRLSARLVGTLVIDEIGEVILSEVISALKVESSSFMLIDGTELSVRVASWGGKIAFPEESIRLKIGEGVAGVVIKDGEYEIVNNPDEDPRFIKGKRMIRNLLCVPLKVGNKCLGVLNISNTRDERDFSSEEARLAMVFANQAAVAIENANLHQDTLKKERYKAYLERYLSKDIVNELIKTDEWLGLSGRKQKVTILFADMRNFTHIAENISPDNLIKLLNDFFSEMTDAVFSHKGTVDKFIGDMMMATFGVPYPKPDDAKRAVETAIDMQMRAQILAKKWSPLSISIGIGINTGEVIFGNIGSLEHMDFTVIGDPVNIAQRLEGIALPGQILVTNEIANETKDDFYFRNFEEVTVKGKAKPLLVKEVVY
ncbi:GAF domain-containing protein [bacterium]|nr:GAF domain-containing protein [bacterium]MBU1599094.1 GAF domain-containing protein [bacterium]